MDTQSLNDRSLPHDGWQRVGDALLQGNYEQAIAYCQQTHNQQTHDQQPIAVEPDHRMSYWYLGIAWLLQGELAEAEATWLAVMLNGSVEAVEEWTAELVTVLMMVADQMMQHERWLSALQLYEQVGQLYPEQTGALLQLGLAHARLGDLEQAIATWQRVIALHTNEPTPHTVAAYHHLAITWQQLGQYDDAIAAYHQILFEEPDAVLARYHLGLCLFHQAQIDAAIAQFRQVVQQNATLAMAQGELGMALLCKGELAAGITLLHHALNRHSIWANQYRQWAEALATHDRLDAPTRRNSEGLTALLTHLQGYAIYLALATLMAHHPDPVWSLSTTIACYEAAIACQPDAIEAWGELAALLLRQQQFDRAIALYQHALAHRPQQAELYLALGTAFAGTGDFAAALSAYAQAAALQPDLLPLYVPWGDALWQVGQQDAAIACYQRKCTLDPTAGDAWYRLGLIFLKAGQLEAALTALQAALRCQPALASSIAEQLRTQPAIAAHLQSHLWVEGPVGFYTSAWDWAVACQMETHYVQVHPDCWLALTPPKTLDSEVDVRFRFGMGVPLPASFVVRLPGGRYWIEEDRQVAVLTTDHQILADVSPDSPILSPGHPDKHPARHPLLSQSALPVPQSLEGRVAVLASLSNDAYFHWLFDVLPRFELLRLGGWTVDTIDYFVVNHHLPFQQESLEQLGIPVSKTLSPASHPHIRATELVVPSFPGSISWMPRWTCDFLRQCFLSREAIAATPQIERLYITRSQTTARRVINEAEVVEFLHQRGFQVVATESLSIREQAALLAQAQVVVAPHGGGVTNIVFCRPGTTVIELFSPNYIYPCYWLVSNLMELEYYYVVGECPYGWHLHRLLYPNPRLEDMWIDIAKLKATLEWAERHSQGLKVLRTEC